MEIKSVYLKSQFVFFDKLKTKLEIKFWFLFLYWSWDIKKLLLLLVLFWLNNWTLKLKFEVRFSLFILFWKMKNQIYLNKYLNQTTYHLPLLNN